MKCCHSVSCSNHSHDCGHSLQEHDCHSVNCWFYLMTSDKPVNTEDLVLPDDYNLHIFYLYIKIREQDEK